ncbi:6-carboxytetrahydropterin synthase [Marinomonas mediterranea]|jgi:6-pyruvoyl tetrahydropterin synthase.|uniref:Uncharacterized protein n=1 Tax=Marinomonas mediterranea (strain ATCC 700492 / JCM 21426 / NBRC 103028 / MMB-1) TaxID=717774 RepID=F2K268_MARM1|nr:6-carboxytetrahydropterin synthase [Marinomonas mediterranea]ADZ91146.1 hypothetical protein Marme_1893 [Marinomonas mediterranea MMB-1]WCN09122.1 hypothetical protein GV055_09365 [Marinomonas mediterranea]WCN17277.1 hypothetical protein GV053_09535 [Marinomonas mediterranea MMB-1]
MKLFVKNLTHVDLSYFCPEQGVLGESWHTDVILDGGLNDESMICDFSIVKKQIKKWLDDNIDHTLALPMSHAKSTLRAMEDGRLHYLFEQEDGYTFECEAPEQAYCSLPFERITPDQVAQWVETQIVDLLPADIESVKVRFYKENIDGSEYQYTHGLKKHGGNCQRIAHGHRSTIEIYRNGDRDSSLEQDWAKRWEDIYLGTNEDLLGIIENNGKRHHHFAYVSMQGKFELKTRSDRVYMLDCDTTVESLSEHVAEVLAHENPGDQIEVHAFEGIGKGAISVKSINR